MVYILTNCCITEQQTTAINKLIIVSILFLQSGHLAFAKLSILATAAMASTACNNGFDPLEPSDERVLKVKSPGVSLQI